ncbi:DUF1311 domain-containing protein [Taibaiella lutea]|uniref:DUF1311 domain-containing protein n=1 Tax=Taibaiella lutea TaxID=2608001 RepID=A0A5M6CR30_9BACT|nr:lysozyme inhibitor LprI family protein [Taibaiella lutea]KAA5537423.1 DUF1311 domain-containing protein [Taibaiella lutea]
MKYLKIVFAIVILFSALQAKSQSNYSSALSGFENEYQNCLDKGDNMLGCSQQYYQQLDGLLQSVLKDLKTSMKVSQRTTFRNEQTAWTQKKEAYFRQLPKSVKEDNEDLSGADLQMVILDKKSEFLIERINELIGMGGDIGDSGDGN